MNLIVIKPILYLKYLLITAREIIKMDNSTYLIIMSFIFVFNLITSLYYKNKAQKSYYNIKRDSLKQYKLWLLATIVYLVVIILKIVEITLTA